MYSENRAIFHVRYDTEVKRVITSYHSEDAISISKLKAENKKLPKRSADQEQSITYTHKYQISGSGWDDVSNRTKT